MDNEPEDPNEVMAEELGIDPEEPCNGPPPHRVSIEELMVQIG